MTNQEAREYIIRHCNPDYPNGKTEWETAINIAITALKKQIPYFKFACPSCGLIGRRVNDDE